MLAEPVTESGEAQLEEGHFKARLESNWPLVESVIRWVCQRHALAPEEAEEFKSRASVRLCENGYAILRKFRGGSTLRTYLTTVVGRLFLDWRIEKWGKWRPSAEARRAGKVGVLLDRLLYREGHSPREAVALLVNNYQVTISEAELLDLAGRLPHRGRRREEGGLNLGNEAARERADDGLRDREHARQARKVQVALARALSSLPAEDRLILRMRFCDDRPVSSIATALTLDQKSLYRRINRQLAELHAALAEQGVSWADVAEALT